jgi:multidrug efflux pump
MARAEKRIGMPGSIVGLYSGDAAEFARSLSGQPWVVKSRTRGAAFYILIDGNKSTSILHRTYIEPDEL